MENNAATVRGDSNGMNELDTIQKEKIESSGDTKDNSSRGIAKVIRWTPSNPSVPNVVLFQYRIHLHHQAKTLPNPVLWNL